jgi:RHS repeat-associated protein
LPDGRQIAYAYDANGNLASLTPPGRPAHMFRYTARDQTGEYQPPLVAGTGSTAYEYDLDKRLARITRPDGQALNFGYDSAGRLSTLTLPTGQMGYGYNTTTRKPTGITAQDATLAYTYNGALLTRTAWTGSVTGQVDRSYDNDFRVTSLGVNGANPIAFQYDADSLLTKAGDLALTRSAQNGLLTGTALANVTDTYAYNGFSEVTAYEAKYNTTSLLRFEYAYDKLGRITQKKEIRSGTTVTFNYGYDTAGRLVEVKRGAVVTASYGYDTNGNRTHLNGVLVAHYDDQDRLLDYQGATYQYTANGELSTKAAGAFMTTYRYDVLGNLRSVTLPDGRQIQYLIDGNNRRMGKKVDGTLVQAFLYQSELRPIAELDGSGNIVSRFVYATTINVPDYLIKGGVTHRIIKDHLGSPRLVVDVATNTVVQAMEYDAFGNVIVDTNPGFQPFGYAGGLYDPETSLIRFGARDYDAETGRWTAKDSIWFRGADANLYGYTGADPGSRSDPTGLMPPSGGVNGAAVCPLTEPNSCESTGSQWTRDKRGGEIIFHGNNTCYREVRLASGISTAQCCYERGTLVPEGRWYSGSADEFDPDIERGNHIWNDAGGIRAWIEEYVLAPLPIVGTGEGWIPTGP